MFAKVSWQANMFCKPQLPHKKRPLSLFPEKIDVALAIIHPYHESGLAEGSLWFAFPDPVA